MNENDVWLKTNEEKLQSLIGDVAKSGPMLDNILSTLRQLKAKNTFQLALLHQLLEDIKNKE